MERYTVSKSTLITCLDELDTLFKVTEGTEELDEGAMTPLARAKLRITKDAEKLRHQLDENDEDYDRSKGLVLGLQHAAAIIDSVGEETGEETAPIDPLTGEIEAARQELNDTLNP